MGPFKPGLPLEVPLWLATHLRQRQKCRILQPDWMDPAVLEAAKEAEAAEPLFTDLPGGPNMFVLTNCLMDVAVSDLSRADEVKTLVKDIWDIRQSKLRYIIIIFRGFFRHQQPKQPLAENLS